MDGSSLSVTLQLIGKRNNMKYTVQKWGARSDGSTFHWFSNEFTDKLEAEKLQVAWAQRQPLFEETRYPEFYTPERAQTDFKFLAEQEMVEWGVKINIEYDSKEFAKSLNRDNVLDHLRDFLESNDTDYLNENFLLKFCENLGDPELDGGIEDYEDGSLPPTPTMKKVKRVLNKLWQ